MSRLVHIRPSLFSLLVRFVSSRGDIYICVIRMMNWLPEEGLSDDFFDELFKSTDFPLQDIDVDDDNTNGEVGDWYAEFQHLDPPPMDMLTSFPSDFTSSCSVNKLGRVGTVPGLVSSCLLPKHYMLKITNLSGYIIIYAYHLMITHNHDSLYISS